MTSAVETAHVCACGHFRVFHAPTCKECDCDAFAVGFAEPLPGSVAVHVANNTSEPVRVRGTIELAAPYAPPPSIEEPERSAKRRTQEARARPAPSFEAAVRRMRRAQSKARTEHSRRAVELAWSAEREVDGMLEKLADEEPELAALETAPLFATIPAWSEYLRRNPKEAFKEADRIAKEERKLSKARGCDDLLADERAARARHQFLARSKR